MFKETMKSFFKSLRYIVVPMAFIYFGTLSLFLLFIEGIVRAVTLFGSTLANVVKSSSGEVTVHVNDFINHFKTEQNITSGVARSYFDEFIASLKGLSAENLNTLKDSGAQATRVFMTYLIIGAVLFVVGFILSIVITGICIRKDSGMKSNAGKFMIRLLFKIIMLGLLILAIWLIGKVNTWLSIPLTIVYVLLDTFLSFVFAYWLHKGKTKRGLFKTVKFGDILIYFLTAILMYALALGIVLLFVLLIRDVMMAIVIIIPFLVLVSEFFDNHAETYVARKINMLNQAQAKA